MALQILLLGSPELIRDGGQIDVPGVRPLALLAYLLLTGKPHSREHLANLLFDGPDDPRASLRWTLSQLRKAVGAAAIHADRQQIGFNFGGDHWLDVTAFEAGDLDCYRGELLAGVNVRDAHQYDAWLLAQRERLRALYQTGLEERLRAQQEAEDGAAVEEIALRLLELDNLREDWHRALMSAYARQGKFAAAEAQYELCQNILREELDAETAPETAALAEAIEEEQARLYGLLANHSAASFSLANGTTESFAAQERPAQRDKEEAAVAPEDSRRWSWPRIGFFSAILLFLLILVIGLSMGSTLGSSNGTGENSGSEQSPPFSREFAGSTVTLIGTWIETHKNQIIKSFTKFDRMTGIKVNIVSIGGEFGPALPLLLDSELAPDIVDFPQPGFLEDYVRQGRVVDVRTFLDEGYLRQQYGQPLLEAAMVEDHMPGVWFANNLKSQVWYVPETFQAAGYRVPQTWDELMALSKQIVADGNTPWCIGIESGAHSGWPATDWVENILLRTAPPETYDAWVAGELPFDSPEIRRVFNIMEDIWLDEAMVYGGTETIAEEPPWESVLHLFEQPPGCYMSLQPSFILSTIHEQVVDEEGYDLFYLPPIDAAHGRPVLGAGDMVAMFDDRPEVREVMRYLTTSNSVEYLVKEGGMISPYRDTPFDWYASPAQLKMAQILLETDTYRFDGSDLMPPVVGNGTFLRGMVDWVEGEDLTTVLQTIDESWPKEE